MLRRAMIILLGCALAAASTAAWATIVKPFTLRGLATEAHEVIRGEVLDEEVVYDGWWDRVYTHTTIRIDEAIGGTARAGDLIVIRQMGGVLDGLEAILIGTTDYTIGDEVVVFTRTDGAFHYLVGMAQGSYHVLRDSAGHATVARAMGALGLAPLPHPAGRLAPNRTPLADLLAAIVAVRFEGGAP